MVEVGAITVDTMVDGAMADITVGVTMDITDTGDIGATGVIVLVVAGVFAAMTVGVGAGAIVVACGAMAANNNRLIITLRQEPEGFSCSSPCAGDVLRG